MDDPILVTALVLAWAVFFDKPKAIWKTATVNFPRAVAAIAGPAFRLEPMFFKPGVAVGRTRVPLPFRGPLVAIAPPSATPSRKRATQPPGFEPPSPFSQN